MKHKHVRAIRDEKIDLPEAANGRLKALGQVFAWAISEDLAHEDPTAAVDYLSSGSEGFHTWTLEEVQAYEADHPLGSKARLALALLLFTGVRRSDAVKLGRHMERDGVLHFSETKGSNSRALGRKKRPGAKKRALPILPELRAVIDATPSGNLTYLVTAFDRPWTAAGFGNKFREWCDLAGLKQCSAHGLRKAGATSRPTTARPFISSWLSTAGRHFDRLKSTRVTRTGPGWRPRPCTYSCAGTRTKRARKLSHLLGGAKGATETGG
jgi:integrase